MEAFSAAACATRIRIAEEETLPVQSIGEIECGVNEIEKALEIGDHFHAVVLKNLVHGLLLIIEVEFITQPGAAASNHAYAQEIRRIIAHPGLLEELTTEFRSHDDIRALAKRLVLLPQYRRVR